MLEPKQLHKILNDNIGQGKLELGKRYRYETYIKNEHEILLYNLSQKEDSFKLDCEYRYSNIKEEYTISSNEIVGPNPGILTLPEIIGGLRIDCMEALEDESMRDFGKFLQPYIDNDSHHPHIDIRRTGLQIFDSSGKEIEMNMNELNSPNLKKATQAKLSIDGSKYTVDVRYLQRDTSPKTGYPYNIYALTNSPVNKLYIKIGGLQKAGEFMLKN